MYQDCCIRTIQFNSIFWEACELQLVCDVTITVEGVNMEEQKRMEERATQIGKDDELWKVRQTPYL